MRPRSPRRARLPSNLLAVGLLAWLAWSTHAPALARDAEADVDLRGVTALRVTISPMSAAALECGLRSNDLLRDVQAGLAAGGISTSLEVEDLATITVITGREPTSGLCSSAVMLGAYARESFVDRRAGWIRTGYVVLWQSGVMVTSMPYEHADTVRDALDRLDDALLDSWHRSNLVP